MQVDRSGTGAPGTGFIDAAGAGGSAPADVSMLQGSRRRHSPAWPVPSEGPASHPVLPPRCDTVEVHWTVRLQQSLQGLQQTVHDAVDRVVDLGCEHLGLTRSAAAASGDDPEPDAAAAALADLQDAVALELAQWAADAPRFHAEMDLRFGPGLDPAAVAALREACLRGDWTGAPEVVLVDDGASAARYDAATDTVVICRTLLHSDPAATQKAWIQALAEAVDVRLPRVEAAGGAGGAGAAAATKVLADDTTVGATTGTTTGTTKVTTTGNTTVNTAGTGGPASAPRPPSDPDPGRPTVLWIDPSHATVARAGGPVIRPEWLQQRDGALDALGSDIDQARLAALAQGPGGLGWIPMAPHWPETESGHQADPIGPQGQALQRVVHDGEEAWWGFCESTFTAQQQARMQVEPTLAMQQLGVLYGVAPQDLFTQRPALWALAQQADRLLHAGEPPLPGVAMGDATQLGLLDLMLADPQNRQLIDAFGGTVAEPTSALALEQVRLYGRVRWEQLTRLDQAMQAVRDGFDAAMQQARDHGGPGWIDVPMQTGTDPQTGQPLGVFQTDVHGEVLRDSAGQPLLATTRVFSPAVFADTWLAQDGLAQRAFADSYGRLSSRVVLVEEAGEAGGRVTWAVETVAEHVSWGIPAGETALRNLHLSHLDLGSPPQLVMDGAVWFDPANGWSTPHDNLRQRRDFGDRVAEVAPVFIMAAVAWASAGTLGPQMAASFGMTTTATVAGVATTTLTASGVVVAAGVTGLATSLAGAAISGELKFSNVVRGTLGSALTAGMMNGLGEVFTAVQEVGSAAHVVARMTVGGAVELLLGGSLEDGLRSGLAASLASALGSHLSEQIELSGLEGAERVGAVYMAKLLTSAVTALGDKDNPGYAFAAAFLDSVMQELPRPTVDELLGQSAAVNGSPHEGTSSSAPGVTEEVFKGLPLGMPLLDDEGMPASGAVDLSSPPAVQAQQLAVQLQAQGLSPDDAARTAIAAVGLQQGTARVALGADGATGSEWAGGSPSANTELDIVILGQRLPRDDLGNLYDTDAQGRQVVYLASGGMLALSAAEAAPMVGRLVTPGAAVLARLAGASGLIVGAAAGVAVTLLVGAGNAQQDPLIIELNEHTRFEQRPGESFGRVLDKSAQGEWEPRTQSVLLQDGRTVQQPIRYFGSASPSGFVVISDDDLARLRGPIFTPPAPPLPSLPPSSSDGQGVEGLPPFVEADPDVELGPDGLEAYELRLIDLIIESNGYRSGTPEHKAAAWEAYQERPNGGWDFDRWSVTYEQNQVRAGLAREAEMAYWREIGWGTVQGAAQDLVVDGVQTKRHLDIVEEATRRGVEVKTGYQSATVDNLWELERDKLLVEAGWRIEWVFMDARPSQPLLERLNNAGITVVVKQKS